MKKLLQTNLKKALGVVVLVMALVCFGKQSFAQLQMNEDFTGGTVGYSVTASPISWGTNGAGNGTFLIANAVPITYAGYKGGGGNYVAVTKSTSNTINVGPAIGVASAATSTYYYSFLLNVSSVSATGSFFSALGTTISSGVFFGKLFAKASGSGYVLGISKLAATGVFNGTPTILNFNTTYLVLVKYSYVTGTSNDIAYVWINPSLASEPSTGTAEATDNPATADPAATTTSSVFTLRNTVTDCPNYSIDGVRVAYATTSATAWTNLDALSTSPALSVSTSVLSFSNQATSTSSDAKSFNLSGANLTGTPGGDITVTAPTHFEVSNDNSTWGSTALIHFASATLSSTPVYVRFSPTSTGLKTGNVTFSGGGITSSPAVAVSGTGVTAVNWTNSSGSAWSTGSNWSTGVAPTTNDIVTFNGPYTVLVTGVPAITLASLTIGSNANVTFSPAAGSPVVTLSNSGRALDVQSGGTLVLQAIQGGSSSGMGIAFSGTGNTATIAGTLKLTAGYTGTPNQQATYNATNSITTVSGVLNCDYRYSVTSTASNLIFSSTGKFLGSSNNGNNTLVIPTATFQTGSTCEIAYATGTITGLGQSFYNFTVNSSSMAGALQCSGALTTINGDFNVTNTNGQSFVLAAATGVTLAVKGNLTIGTNSTLDLANGASLGSCIINLEGNFSTTGTGKIIRSAGTGTNTLNFTKASGIQTFSSTSTGISTNTITWNVGTGSTTNTLQLQSNFVMSNSSALNVLIGSTLDCGTYIVQATTANTLGNFTLNSGGTLAIGSTAGISSSGATGNIQTATTRSFSTSANYIYNGTGNQVTGTGLPTNLTGTLTINNPGYTVTLDNARTIANGGTVNIVNGTFAAGSNLTMAPTSSITRSGGIMTGTPAGTGTYNITYTGNSMTATTELAGSGLNNVTVNLTPGQTLTLDQNPAPNGDLSISAGTFDLSTFTINRSAPGGTLTVSNGAKLKIGGTNSFPTNYTTNTLGTTSTVEYSGTAQTIAAQSYGNLTLSTGGTKSISGSTSSTPTTVRNDLTINSGPNLTIPANQYLTVNGSTFLAGSKCLVIQSTSSGTGSFIDNGTITYSGSATVDVQRYLASGQWHYICVPFATINAWSYKTLYMKYYAEPLHRYKYVIAAHVDSTLNSNGLGYAMWANSTVTVDQIKNSLNTGSITIPTTRTAYPTTGYDGWNLVGNPYPSSINLHSAGITWNTVDKAAYFYNSGVYNVWVYGGGGSHTSDFCPPEQGFFVQMLSGSNGSVVMDNTARVHSSEPFVKQSNDLPNLLRIKSEGTLNAIVDELSVYFNNSLTEGYDHNYDAEKLDGDATAPEIYTTIPDHNLAVNAQPFSHQNMVIPMSFKISLAGTYMLVASNLESFKNDISILLEDMKLSVTQDLRINPVYNFSYDTIDNTNRFLLHFDNPSFGVNDSKNIQPVQIYSFGNAIYIKSQDGTLREETVSVYDLIGKELFHGTLSNQSLNRLTPSVVEGYYLVRVVTDAGSYNGKVYLR